MAMWWDMRRMEGPIEKLILDPTKTLDPNKALGAMTLEYEPTIPTRLGFSVAPYYSQDPLKLMTSEQIWELICMITINNMIV